MPDMFEIMAMSLDELRQLYRRSGRRGELFHRQLRNAIYAKENQEEMFEIKKPLQILPDEWDADEDQAPVIESNQINLF